MEELSDKEKLKEIRQRIKKLISCNELFLDSINQNLCTGDTDKYFLLWDWCDKYLYEINCIYDCEDEYSEL